jgi:hypothetical protein
MVSGVELTHHDKGTEISCTSSASRRRFAVAASAAVSSRSWRTSLAAYRAAGGVADPLQRMRTWRFTRA